MTDDTEAQLVAYVDGELEPEEARRVEQLLATDARARHLVEVYRTTASLLRAACGEAAYAAQPEQFLPTRRIVSGWRRRGLGLALAASVALCVVGGAAAGSWWYFHDWGLRAMANEVAEYHAVYSRETRHLVEVPAEQKDDLTGWLGRRLERTLVVPDLTDAGLRFAGARMLVIDEKPAAALFYVRNSGLPISICIGQSKGPAEPVRLDRRGALGVVYWRQGGYAYVIAGELGDAALRRLADEVSQQIGI